MINKGLDQWYVSGVTPGGFSVVPLTHIKHLQQIYRYRMTLCKPVHVISMAYVQHVSCAYHILFTDYSGTVVGSFFQVPDMRPQR